jgi:hypothetical protein
MLAAAPSVEHFIASLKLTSNLVVLAVTARETAGSVMSGTVICQKIP